MTNIDKTAAFAALRRGGPLALGAVCLWLLAGQLRGLDWQAVRACFLDIPLWRWGLAALATGASFVALAQYDLIAHRHFGTGADPGAARRAGASAIALGQATGFGPVVGAAVRWRLLPGLTSAEILRLTGFITLTFFGAWGLLVLTVGLPMVARLQWIAQPVLALGALAVAAALLRWPVLRLGRWQMRLPSLPAAGTMLGLTFLDLLFAGAALWLLFPQGAVPGLAVFASAYALALGAGLMAGTPGGAGPFDLALVALLPQTGAPELVAALLGFRILYYALPAGLAAIYALLARPKADRSAGLAPARCFTGARPEHGIAAQAPALTLEAGGARATLLPSPQCLTLFLGPQSGGLTPLLPALKDAARQMNRLPVLYKLAPSDAVMARRAGWSVALQGHEALLNPQDYTLASPERRQLRRALRKAESAGVTIERPKAPDWLALAEVNAAWTAHHGAERGLTMGRFCPGFLADKPVFVARHAGRVIAFATLVTSPGCQSLDIMRHVPDLPGGTMQALIHAMICQAQRSGIVSFSLAGLPAPALSRFAPGAAGLARFKGAFGPRLAPRYMAAPDRASLAIAAADLWQAVQHPPALETRAGGDWHLAPLAEGADNDTTTPLRLAS